MHIGDCCGSSTVCCCVMLFFFFSSRRRHTRCSRDWSSDVCSSDLVPGVVRERRYTGAAAFYLVETELGDRLEVLARPEAARVGDRVYLEAVRVLAFPGERA